MHFAPQDGIYILARILDNETVVYIINKNENPKELDLSRFEELGLSGKTLTNIISKETLIWNSSLILNTKGSTIFTTKTL